MLEQLGLKFPNYIENRGMDQKYSNKLFTFFVKQIKVDI